ncbi:hypothetical protein HX045_10030 [Myroides odoratimimus]|uniref:5-bromo-4-chloroindolyl phosphate hydrolysis protein n=1 Tax=Myroides odoratimimus CCUG 10230 TaxID=883150 RepID=A0ABP2NAW0_9FLAO|nr:MULTISPECIES: hypothetical protein [Myroides]AJA67561.1 hypothetical protein MYRA21_0334 [Myroides sp. A21]APA90883.1 hypothetical protein BK054_01205 [Myroides sp. ZB35]EHO08897.1 hypothetical protein HMPREF9712_01988 [Myroides odoratimimus CCUG 10230]EKB04891.1 hypothetical protein HMPREF9711_01573 [Myroides odoratimimus CCUG 3837]EPH13820.1 hypothetical protein HMPREF9713_00004 [Myroides odoratimimus CCUG 12700]
MGWFTNRNKTWEIREGLVLLGTVGIISFLSLGVLTPLVVMIFGYQVKVTRWIKTSFLISLVYLLVLLIALFVYLAGESPVSLLTLNYISFYIYVVYLALYLPEYLQRLDLKNYIKLEKNKEYNYYVIMEQLEDVQSSESLKESFMANLRTFRRQISNPSIVNEIDEILRLIDVIVLKESASTDLLLERHVSTIENALIQYIELNNSYHINNEVKQSISKLENLVKYARIALENELSKIIETQVLTVDGEASVYLSVLKGKGLL